MEGPITGDSDEKKNGQEEGGGKLGNREGKGDVVQLPC